MGYDISFTSSKAPKEFKKEEFEEYCASIGYQIAVHPKSDFFSSSGFFPLKVSGNIIFTHPDSEFLTGFELYSSFEDEFHFFCNCYDELEITVALILSSYFLTLVGGEVSDPQIGDDYSNHEDVLEAIKMAQNRLNAVVQSGRINLHPFEGWR